MTPGDETVPAAAYEIIPASRRLAGGRHREFALRQRAGGSASAANFEVRGERGGRSPGTAIDLRGGARAGSIAGEVPEFAEREDSRGAQQCPLGRAAGRDPKRTLYRRGTGDPGPELRPELSAGDLREA